MTAKTETDTSRAGRAAGSEPPSAAFLAREPDRQGPPPEARYEVRIWPRRPHPAVSLLQGGWPQSGAERRADIYLVHPESERVLVKLRGGERLEIKRLARRIGSVERWTMPVSTDFPLSAPARQAVAEALDLPGSPSEVAGTSPAHLLAALDGPVRARTVRKSRLLFEAGCCRAEICRVAIDDWTGTTLALEAEDLPALTAAMDTLGLGDLPNRSYGALLLRIPGQAQGRPRLGLTRDGPPAP
ncbi:MAG: hypothetical protein ACOCTP_04160 [Roseicyclus sp.]